MTSFVLDGIQYAINVVMIMKMMACNENDKLCSRIIIKTVFFDIMIIVMMKNIP